MTNETTWDVYESSAGHRVFLLQREPDLWGVKLPDGKMLCKTPDKMGRAPVIWYRSRQGAQQAAELGPRRRTT